jgi:hypothetical protein
VEMRRLEAASLKRSKALP